LVENRRFFSYLPAFDVPVITPREYRHKVRLSMGQLEWRGYPTVEKVRLGLLVSTQYRRVTDGQTSCDSIVRAVLVLGTVEEPPANLPYPALDLHLTGDHLCG